MQASLITYGKEYMSKPGNSILVKNQSPHPLVIIHIETYSLPKVLVFQIILKVSSKEPDIILNDMV